jgi:hypothetical protein
MEELLSLLSMESATVGLADALLERRLVKFDEACGAILPWTVEGKKKNDGYFLFSLVFIKNN